MLRSTETEPVLLRHPNGIATVRFRWTGDRFDHAAEFESGRVACLETSLESHWPDSPPIQQLSIETIEGRDVALGVGCAGTSHWSLSVEPTEDGFRFDWACRAKETPLQLGTSYDDRAAAGFHASDQAVVTSIDEVTRIEHLQRLDGPGTYRWCYTLIAPE